jgi:hypothetical protein
VLFLKKPAKKDVTGYLDLAFQLYVASCGMVGCFSFASDAIFKKNWKKTFFKYFIIEFFFINKSLSIKVQNLLDKSRGGFGNMQVIDA